MRICFLRFISLDTTIGYTETLDLINYMSRENHKLFLIILKSNKTITISDYFDKNVVVYQIPTIHERFCKGPLTKILNLILYTLFTFFILIKLSLREKLDIIHFYPETTIPAFMFSRFSKRNCFILDIRKPTIIQAEELELNYKLIPLLITFYSFLEKISFQVSNGIIAITKGVKRYVRKRLVFYKIDVKGISIIPCSVDLKIFKKSENNQFKLRIKNNILENDKVILYLGSISVGREFQKVLEIFSEILKRKNGVKFVILGKIDSKLNKLIDKIDIRAHTIVRYVPHHQISSLIDLADVCISFIPDIPTYRYSCPLKVLEYMSMEKPVVATNINAHKQIIQHHLTGLLSKSDSDSFMKAIIDVLNNPDIYKKIGKNARKFVEDNYSLEVIGSKYKDYLKNMLKKRVLN